MASKCVSTLSSLQTLPEHERMLFGEQLESPHRVDDLELDHRRAKARVLDGRTAASTRALSSTLIFSRCEQAPPELLFFAGRRHARNHTHSHADRPHVGRRADGEATRVMRLRTSSMSNEDGSSYFE